MEGSDLLVLAGTASEILESYGLVACGRREGGVARIDFWTREGVGYRYELRGGDGSVEDVVQSCLAMAGFESIFLTSPAARSN